MFDNAVGSEAPIRHREYIDPAIAERLKQARIDAGYVSAKVFALANGINVTTYQHHENGRRGLHAALAERYAALLNIPVSSLILFGDQLHIPKYVTIVGVVIDGGKIKPMDGISSQDNRAQISTHTRKTRYEVPSLLGLDTLIAGDDSFYPSICNGNLVFHDQIVRNIPFPEELNGQECVVEYEDGARAIRIVTLQQNGRVTLVSYRSPPETNQVIVGYARIVCVFRGNAND